MKKLASILVVMLLAWPVCAQYVAQPTGNKSLSKSKHTVSSPAYKSGQEGYGIHKGNGMLSLELGGGIPVSYDMKDNVKSGFMWGVSGLYSVTDSAALGLEISGFYAGEKTEYYGIKEEVKGDIHQFMLAGRLYANPADQFRFYVPIGLGLALAHMKDSVSVSGNSFSDSHTSGSFAMYAGVGVEGDISDRVVLGIEGRYNFTQYKATFYENIDVKADLGYVSVLARIGYKF